MTARRHMWHDVPTYAVIRFRVRGADLRVQVHPGDQILTLDRLVFPLFRTAAAT